MKSQVNALLHVIKNGLLRDCLLAYPALEGSLSKDMERLTLYCQSRGLGFFTLDLPSLNALLLEGLKTGRLELYGPLSRAVSKRTRVPRLFSGLWLRVFDRDANLKPGVDTTALSFLQMFLTFGSKLEVECTSDRIKAVMKGYYDVESKLRKPTLGWDADCFGLAVECENAQRTVCDEYGRVIPLPLERVWDPHYGSGHCGHLYSDHPGVLHGTPVYPECLGDILDLGASRRRFVNPMHVHLVQAKDSSSSLGPNTLPLFREEKDEGDRIQDLEDQRLLRQIQKVADLIVGRFDEYHPIHYSGEQETSGEATGFKHGPGAVAESVKRWEKSHFLNWPQKLQGTFPFESCGKTAGDPRGRPRSHEPASRLMAVPKTAKGPRLIASEPASHMWCQQLTWRWLRSQCRRIFGSDFIDFTNQQLSADLVLECSRDRKLATVDLSDASDRLTCWTVERMFRCNASLLTALHAARTRFLKDDVLKDGDFLLLRKFASQGTATTFPIMSVVMLFISLGACLEGEVTWRKIWELSSQVRVFGDDIIIPTHGYARLCRAMELLQLKVNMAKSYATGHFRESCGTYGYCGDDVTPIRPKTIVGNSPASCQAVVDNTNNLFNKGYWHASTACLSLIPARIQRGLRIVGPHDVGSSGLAAYSGGDESHLDKRWNKRLHRYDVRVWGLSPNKGKRPRGGYTTLLEFFSRIQNPNNPRVVSEYVESRKARGGFRWEPANYCGDVLVRS